MTDPRELAAVVEDGIQGERDDPTSYVQAAYVALAALVAECERLKEYKDQWNELSSLEFIEYWQTIGYTCSAGTAIKALLARARRYEEALLQAADALEYDDRHPKAEAALNAVRAALAEEKA